MLKERVRRIVQRFGYDFVRYHDESSYPPDFSADEIAQIKEVWPYTMTSRERLVSLIRAARYVHERDIPGAIVECGVWRGGSMMAVARALVAAGGKRRDLYLFDTYEGMARPTQVDVDYLGGSAVAEHARLARDGDGTNWCYAPIEEVRANLLSTGYESERVHLVKGRVEETIPSAAPAEISLLRLDTDWYESTLHELVHLFPRVSSGGIVIIDDYGHWEGCKRATDEYLSSTGARPFLSRIDYTARLIVKQ